MTLCGSMRTRIASGHSWSQHVVASALLGLVAFLVFNPIWECHDHMDDLRHLGSNGLLVIVLLMACAGISLLRSLCWFFLRALRVFPWNRPVFISSRSCAGKFLRTPAVDLPQPLRI